jgi:hypothetical protein
MAAQLELGSTNEWADSQQAIESATRFIQILNYVCVLHNLKGVEHNCVHRWC